MSTAKFFACSSMFTYEASGIKNIWIHLENVVIPIFQKQHSSMNSKCGDT